VPDSEQQARSGERIRRGIGASHGIAIGRAYVVDRRRLKVPRRKIEDDEIDSEVERFHRAVATSERQLEKIKQKIREQENDHYNILTAHELMLKDDHLIGETVRSISDSKINAEWALRQSVERIKAVFDAVEDDYFRERRSDVEFVGERVLRNLMGRDTRVAPPPDAIVVAHDLSPADTAQFHRAAVAAIATDVGGKTSHTAIIARGHEIPAVVGLESVTGELGTGDLLIVDGSRGLVIINPQAETVTEYRDRARREAARGLARLSSKELPAVTLDKQRIELLANLDQIDEAVHALELGAEGVGLFRTEYPFMASDSLPSEEDHFEYAMNTMKVLGDRVVTFRTLDLGADKLSGLLPEQHMESNPALGMRSIRLCLTKAVRPIFRDQLRGLLRASAHGRMRLMFPMISGLEELRQAREFFEEVRQELREEGIPFAETMPVGVMIEMPSAAVIADHLAKEVDFFSIGTNDLIQYTLAVDRVNEFVSYLYEPLHPSLLRLIDRVIRAAEKAGIPASVCGEMAGDPDVAPVLIGLGVKQLSMHAVAIPDVKNVIRKLGLAELARLSSSMLDLPSALEIRVALDEFLSRLEE
jgi:phosphotransferase system enzyme I (PtsI)